VLSTDFLCSQLPIGRWRATCYRWGPMSNPILVQDRRDAHVLSQLSNAHSALRQCQGRQSALVRSLTNLNEVPATSPAEPDLERVASTIGAIERQIGTLVAALSPVESNIYRALFRAKRLPFVARLVKGACSVCNVRVPSALASSIDGKGNGEQCPSCSRLLLPAQPLRAAMS
jgi:predicted  nucleic acid-binding Zn-ribbon protein